MRPVLKLRWSSMQGILSVMVGGDEELFHEFQPAFETVGESVFHLGPWVRITPYRPSTTSYPPDRW
jgi:3-hydroxyisobutyrate dehydrogenase-like beta-hydroxyacid dehydrogenase